MRATRIVSVVVLAVALSACGKKAGDAKMKSYPDSIDGLKAYITDLRAAVDGGKDKLAQEMAASAILPKPDEWFKAEFPDKADKLGAEYKDADAAGLIAAMKHAKAKNLVEVRVEKFDSKDDMNATGYQSFALADAKAPIVLYSVRLKPAGGGSGIHLYSWIYQDGAFRFVGKLKEVRGKGDSAELDAVAELRGKDREEFFKSGNLPDDL